MEMDKEENKFLSTTNTRSRKKSLDITDNKKYEIVNFLSKTGDSIFALPNEQSFQGEIFFSESLIIKKIKEIVRQELLASGVLRKEGDE
jgi:hypothetical protein